MNFAHLFAYPFLMKPSCPNKTCLFFKSKGTVHKDGTFFRKCESRFIQRFKCNTCGKKFSHATNTLEFAQKKRSINSILRGHLASGVSMRRSALLLNVNRITIERKFIYLAKKAQISQAEFLKSLRGQVTHAQFDDLITIEHTKLKPLTVSMAVDAKKRFILGARVAPISSFGHLAKLSRRKYGKRKNEHKKSLDELFQIMTPTLAPEPLLRSDEHKFYPAFVKKYVPEAKHEAFKSRRASVAGQGELKKLYRDPLFAINHACATLRANINRLFRKTWCTTKKKERLQMHIDIFVNYHNTVYLN